MKIPSDNHDSRSRSGALSRDRFLRIGASTVATIGTLRARLLADEPVNASSNVAVFSTTSGALPIGVAGLSYEKSKLATKFFTLSNQQLLGCMKRLGPSTLRIGGNSVDKTTWTPSGSGSTRGQIAPSDVRELASLLRASGWKLIYGINLGNNTPELATAEAAFVAPLFGESLASFEIGNECDAYSKNGFRPASYAVNDFIAEWSKYVAAIRQNVPNAPFSGPASGYRLEDWTIPFAASEGSMINALTQHYYQGNGKDPSYTMKKLLASHDFFPKILEKLKNAATSNNISGGFRLTEANSLYSGGGQGVSNAHGSALWVIDFLMTSSQYGSGGANIHGGGDGTYNGFYTPIADVHSEITEIRPVFYGMLLVSRIPPGPMHTVNVSSTINLSAYAVAGHDGATYLIIVNKDEESVARTSIDLPRPAIHATEMALTGPDLSALTGTQLGGSTIETDGSWFPQRDRVITLNGASSFSIDLKPASAKLIKIR